MFYFDDGILNIKRFIKISTLKSNKITRELVLKLIKKISIHQSGDIDIYFNFKELDYYFNKRDT